ncbi:MAG TPA: hypothetical protein PLN52_04985 [Opitutaceae bacterium]|nr:hypothetical protein [Opitutaceae bacterium]
MKPSAKISPETRPQGGAVYKLVVRSAEEAVQTIRAQLGEHAKVLSVRQLPGQGLAGLFGRPRLEVIAQIGGDEREETQPAATLASTVSAASVGSLKLGGESDTATESSLVSASSHAQRQDVRSRVDVPATKLPDLLRRSGFSETLVARLQATPAFATDRSGPLHRALADFGQALRSSTSRHAAQPLADRVAFLGTTGSGRTTALCKWLARSVFVQGLTGKVYKAEFDRPNPTEGLSVFCEALGLNLDHYVSAETETPAIAKQETGRFVYADLPALSVRSPGDNAAVRRFLDVEHIGSRVLVMNALYDLSTLRSVYSMGRDLGATHLVFTHLDELNHWGKLWDFLIDGELTPLFLATGPSLTGDFEEDAVGAVLRRTLPGS